MSPSKPQLGRLGLSRLLLVWRLEQDVVERDAERGGNCLLDSEPSPIPLDVARNLGLAKARSFSNRKVLHLLVDLQYLDFLGI